ncbi:MAG TPA: L-threonylcarbamoyladenylate synthase [Nitrososphaera sp.]|nr:L-threonylcarbamoyladenylate synthase [Nitrososphaera sp.]
MIVVECTKSGISQCVQIIKQGGVAVFPTDTVYGIGCDPYNQSAVNKVFRIKRRKESKPLPVLVSDEADAGRLVNLGEKGRLLASRCWPGPVTIVAPLLDRTIASTITAGTDSLGVRVPANKCVLSLLQHCRYLVGTSANLAGEVSPKSASDVLESGLQGFDVLLDGGLTGSGKESTIVDVTSLSVIREGAISLQRILEILEAGKS